MKRTLMSIAAAALALCSTSVGAQDWKARWDDVQAKSKGQALAISVHSQDGYAATVRAFQRKFPAIKVAITEIIPDAMVTRVLNEQKNNVFAWDVMWASTTNMNSLLIPAGAYQDLEPFLILPEITDANNWHAPDYQWTTGKAKQIFIHALFRATLGFQNMDNSKGFKVEKLSDLLDPRLKGKIGIRDPYHANAGTWTFGAYYLLGGADFLKRFYSEMGLVLNMNPRQAADALMRGDLAVGLGITNDVVSRCRRAGACANVFPLPFGEVIGSRGVAVFKNAPNPAAATVFVNWLLSKDGQETFVAEFAKLNDDDAISRRKDVKPASAHHALSMPEFDKLKEAFIPGIDAGNDALSAAMKLYIDVRGGPR